MPKQRAAGSGVKRRRNSGAIARLCEPRDETLCKSRREGLLFSSYLVRLRRLPAGDASNGRETDIQAAKYKRNPADRNEREGFPIIFGHIDEKDVKDKTDRCWHVSPAKLHMSQKNAYKYPAFVIPPDRTSEKGLLHKNGEFKKRYCFVSEYAQAYTMQTLLGKMPNQVL
jgi:hypothetical protein